MTVTASGAQAVSVVVPVHEDGDPFRRCLEALAALSPAPLERIVVCDGPGGGTAPLARAGGCLAVEIDGPRGPAAARNAGARAARGELLLFLDADVVAPPDLPARVALRFVEEPGLAALIGSYDDAPADPGFLSQYRNLLHHYVHQTSERRAGTFWGACGAIRRELFLATGGFDESYRTPSIEDIELGVRLARAGHRIALDPALQVKHLKRWNAGALLKTDFLRRALPWTRLILRERRLPDDLNLRRSARATTAALFAALLASGLAVFRAEALLAVPPLLAAALALNLGFYGFLRRRRGALFAAAAVPWHWLYFLCSGAAFGVGLLEHLLAARRRARR